MSKTHTHRHTDTTQHKKTDHIRKVTGSNDVDCASGR